MIETLLNPFILLFVSTSMAGQAAPELHSLYENKEAARRMTDHQSLKYNKIRIPVRTIGNKKIYIVLHECRNTARSNARLVVFSHGIMSDHESWRLLDADIARHADILIIDHIGCGHSDCPSPKDVGENGYSPDALAVDLLTALQHYLKEHQDYKKITLVGHSLGSMAILRMWTNKNIRNQFNKVLAKVDGQVLLTPVDVIIKEVHPRFLEMATTTNLEWMTARATGILRYRINTAILGAVTNPRLAYKEEAVRIVRVLSNDARRQAVSAMIMQAVPLIKSTMQVDYPKARLIEAGYKNVGPPTLVIWGAQDDVFSQAMGFKVMAQIPRSQLLIIENGKHDLPMERPEIISRALIDFMKNGIDTKGRNHDVRRTGTSSLDQATATR